MHVPTLKYQLGINDYVVTKLTADITAVESLVRPSAGGNCCNWVLGHIVLSRQGSLSLVGRQSAYPKHKFARYSQGTAPLTDKSEALPWPELAEAFTNLGQILREGLNSLSPEALAAKARFSPLNNPDETVGSLLAGVVFHESYHVGQLGLLRTLIGKERVLG